MENIPACSPLCLVITGGNVCVAAAIKASNAVISAKYIVAEINQTAFTVEPDELLHHFCFFQQAGQRTQCPSVSHHRYPISYNVTATRRQRPRVTSFHALLWCNNPAN